MLWALIFLAGLFFLLFACLVGLLDSHFNHGSSPGFTLYSLAGLGMIVISIVGLSFR